MKPKKLYVVNDVYTDGETTGVAAFDTMQEAKDFINQQENTFKYLVQEVPYGVPVDEKPVMWNAFLKTKGRFVHIQMDREDETFQYKCRIGMVRVMYDCLNIWFLAKNQEEAETFAERMIGSILDREKLGWFKWMRQPVFQVDDRDVTSLTTPYYDFQTGQPILPDNGHFIMPMEQQEKEDFRMMRGSGPYEADTVQEPLKYYSPDEWMEKKEE